MRGTSSSKSIQNQGKRDYKHSRFIINKILVYCSDEICIFDFLTTKSYMMKSILFTLSMSVLLFSCVSSKKYKGCMAMYDTLNTKMMSVQSDLANCNTDKSNLSKQRDDLQSQNSDLNNKVADLNKQ